MCLQKNNFLPYNCAWLSKRTSKRILCILSLCVMCERREPGWIKPFLIVDEVGPPKLHRYMCDEARRNVTNLGWALGWPGKPVETYSGSWRFYLCRMSLKHTAFALLFPGLPAGTGTWYRPRPARVTSPPASTSAQNLVRRSAEFKPS